jgi:hypothetical protein
MAWWTADPNTLLATLTHASLETDPTNHRAAALPSGPTPPRPTAGNRYRSNSSTSKKPAAARSRL